MVRDLAEARETQMRSKLQLQAEVAQVRGCAACCASNVVTYTHAHVHALGTIVCTHAPAAHTCTIAHTHIQHHAVHPPHSWSAPSLTACWRSTGERRPSWRRR